MNLSANKKMALLAAGIFALDQMTKKAIQMSLSYGEEKTVVDGFFNLVHLRNTGAAWSMFSNNNGLLTVVAAVALVILFLTRHRFDIHTTLGWTAMGLMFGGIVGNLTDRLCRGYVIDMLSFYIRRRVEGGGLKEWSFPAFNVADSAICIGVALLFILSFQKEEPARADTPAGPDDGSQVESGSSR